MKERLDRFMQGRYGVDQFSRFTMSVAMISIILTIFIRNASILRSILDFIGLAAIFYTYFRMMSRNVSARYEENRKYLQATENIRHWFQKEKHRLQQRKVYHIYKCPSCSQKIRIPRGKGKIEIDCPKCHTKFVKKS